MNIVDANKDPTVIAIQNKVKLRIKQKDRGLYQYAQAHYFAMKRHGVRDIIVPQWDSVEVEYYNKKIEKKKERNTMAKFSTQVELTKNYQKVIVGANDIEAVEDLDYYEGLCRSHAERLLDSVADVAQVSKGTPQAPKVESPRSYTEQHTTKPVSDKVTRNDITTKFLKGGQFNIAVKGINEGKFTLQQINNLSSWEEMQSVLFSK